ncbi:hypothetical protein BP6252_12261 [Coleophoma cylindrospora]|uniref:Uncharacterized protein n=1 Tax=Coleophoma cylindrospora TaxID=1849047 RepID=A0A3D8QGQ9_9HELO|nr:hypothetical protein BP6252_12261 [Coleophoma cylindrospora]
MPLAAFCMAGILFVYTRSSIQAAKQNAKKHREADGGQISWHNENLRRHGILEPPVNQGTIGQLTGLAKDNLDKVKSAGKAETEEEIKIRERASKAR